MPISEDLLFSVAGPLVQCVRISLPQDSIVENDEVFAVVLKSNDPDVILSPIRATITITDNDSRLS